jgi:CubicO group peptidase (beta-lactamase class C family)
MNPNYALHKNPDLILTSFLAVTIIWLSGVCAAQTQLPDAAPAHLTESELVSVVHQKRAQDTTSNHFAGAVLIAHNGKSVFAEAYGLADREHKIPNTLKTRFRTGSLNKVFTAAATCSLCSKANWGSMIR